MNPSSIVLVLIIIIPIINCCIFYCNPDHEFPNSTDGTTEWDVFMNLLNEKTFNRNYTITCSNGTMITIDYHSDLLWATRFKLYNDDDDNTNTRKPILDCYCNQEDCGVSLQNCMKQVRLSMIDYLHTKWEEEMQNNLMQLCKNV